MSMYLTSLKMPNPTPAKKFGLALLDLRGLQRFMEDALYTLAATGDPMDALAGYCHLTRQRDVTDDVIVTEEHHSCSIWIAIQEYPLNRLMAKYQMRKVRSSLLALE
jgi:hypothetical protein